MTISLNEFISLMKETPAVIVETGELAIPELQGAADEALGCGFLVLNPVSPTTEPAVFFRDINPVVEVSKHVAIATLLDANGRQVRFKLLTNRVI